MTKEELNNYKIELDKLYTNYYMATRTNDQRSLDKKKYDAQLAIYNFAQTLPSELLGMFDKEISPGALSVQFADEDVKDNRKRN